MTKISLVICTRNRSAQLRLALEAVQRMRSDHAWEAIIVDNASTDDTSETIAAFASQDPRFRYLREDQPGLGAARDTAWRHANGGIVSFTDDDCYVATDFVDRIADAFHDRPELGYMGGRILLHDPADAPITIMTRTDPFEIPAHSFVKAGALQGANLSFRRDVLEAIGGLSRDMGAGTPFPCEDVDAVASASWNGFRGGYDPRPTVSHHHGRKITDVPKLRAGYNAGRAAYFARFITDRRSRGAYIRGLFREPVNRDLRDDLARTWSYMRSGTSYLRVQGKFAAIPFFNALLAAQLAVLLARRAKLAGRWLGARILRSSAAS